MSFRIPSNIYTHEKENHAASDLAASMARKDQIGVEEEWHQQALHGCNQSDRSLDSPEGERSEPDRQ